MTFPKFIKLPLELQDEVMGNCNSSSLLALAKTSKQYQSQTIPILYRHIDISSHNRPGLFKDKYSRIVSADNPDTWDTKAQEYCETRQQQFFKSLICHPEYRKFVSSLTWTYFSSEDEEDECRQPSEQPMWDAFSLLPNVKSVDFAALTFHRERTPPPLLFPKTTHLRLVGQMSWAFVRAFIDGVDPSQLVSLEFDNLIDFGQLKEGVNIEGDLAEIPESEDSGGNAIVRHPGVMRGHLKRLEGKCSKLKHLALRSLGNDMKNDPRWSAEIDVARYKEWASFIGSVSTTLETLVIEQGKVPNEDNIICCRGRPSQKGTPMDERFLEHLLPVFLDNSWPRLKMLKVLGIGARVRDWVRAWPADMNALQYVKDSLELKFGFAGVSWEVQKEATKTFFFPAHALYHGVD